MRLKKLAVWCVKHDDVTKPLFKKHGIKSFSLKEALDNNNECVDMSWRLLLADLINQFKL